MMFDPEEVQHIMMKQILALLAGIRVILFTICILMTSFAFTLSNSYPMADLVSTEDSICEQDDDLEDDQEEDGDDRDIFYMWDIMVEYVERVRQFLTPNVPDVIDNIQALIPETMHTTPLDEDYVAPATKSILDDLLKEFGDEILNVTMVDEGEDCSPTKDLEELEILLAKDPLSHYTKIRVHSVIIDPKPFIHTQLISPLYGMLKTSKPCKGYNNEETKFEVTSTRNYMLLQVDAHCHTPSRQKHEA
ncbi:hypothetical protein Tco_0516149 [Tanacetum coccineum]